VRHLKDQRVFNFPVRSGIAVCVGSVTAIADTGLPNSIALRNAIRNVERSTQLCRKKPGKASRMLPEISLLQDFDPGSGLPVRHDQESAP
jgi:hypothetical protein